MRKLALLFTLLPLPVMAEMSAADFEAYVTGKTLTYAEGGVTYGIEEYLPGRRVRWSFLGDQCQDGYWYDSNGQICFVYEDAPTTPQCWVFTENEGRLSAAFAGSGSDRKLYEAQQSDQPLLCLGPDVGV